MNRWCRAGLCSAALMVVAHAGWAAGQQGAAPAAAQRAASAAPNLSVVPAAPGVSSAAHPNDDGRIRVQLVARDQVDLSSEISAKIA